MKTYLIKCPNCDSILELGNNKSTNSIRCRYCRNEIFLDDEVERIEVIKHININKTYTNTARVEEAHSKERIRVKELEHEDKQDKQMMFFLIIAVVCIIIGTIFSDSGLGLLEKINWMPENEVRMTTTARQYIGENYEEVIAELKAAGFTNFEMIEHDDIVFGLWSKEGEVEKISINGDSNFSKGAKFNTDSTVIITYHVKKK